MDWISMTSFSGLRIPRLVLALAFGLMLAVPAGAVNVVDNGTFDSNINFWNAEITKTAGTRSWSSSVFGVSQGSIQYITTTGNRQEFRLTDTTTFNAPISSTDAPINLSFYFYKTSVSATPDRNEITVFLIKPSGSAVALWSNVVDPTAGQVIDGNVVDQDISADCDENGTYKLVLDVWLKTGRNGGNTQANFDDIVVDVPSAANNAPTITAGATTVSVTPVNRYGSNTTTISTAFSDADVPGVGAFNVTFKIREPGGTELTLVNNQPNGGGGLTITDQGSGNYTASYVYNPDDAQALGLYDLYMEVTDGTDNAIDGYTSGDNENQLEIDETLPNNAPTITAGATTISVTPVNRYGSNTTTISTAFSDSDVPGVGAFNVTFKIREPGGAELTLVNNQPNGGGGLTITDQGSGNYTASYVYNPDDAQALGLYDLYMEVTDGTDNAIDGYTSGDNENQLEIDETLPNNAPTLTPGAVEPSVTPVVRIGANTTTLSATFNDADEPGVGAFNVSFKVREPNNSSEILLAINQPNGSGGVTIIDNGGGSYTASFVYNPNDAAELGFYDTYFDVTDGTDNAIDGYSAGDNTDELEIIDPPNNPPIVTLGATGVSPATVNRLGGLTTVISTSFSDADAPGVSAFNVTFKIREKNDITELTLVNNQPNGGGGLTITDDGGGDYTASYTYNPSDAADTGLYDLYFEVTDGTDNVIDPYTSNVDELEVFEPAGNQVPTLAASATTVTPDWVLRSGTNTTVISADFTDADDPGVGAFTVTFQVQRPDNSTVETLVNNEPNGSGGLTITDNGGGSYTAEYTWDPPNNQTLGYYDLYCQVDDGTDNATDGFAANPDELQVVNTPPNNAPTVTAGATGVTPTSVDRIGANTTTISTVFSDLDQPGVGAFTVTFKVKDNVEAETILVNALTNGNGGLTISDGGGGSYTASYTWDPADAQAIGWYDLYFEVTDGTDNVIDTYVSNPDELEITTPGNQAPTVTPGATAVSPGTVNRIGANTTTISTAFSDADEPGVGAFNVTFKIREKNDITELTLVNAQPNGGGGLTITDQGSGNYTASYTYDPSDVQDTGYYDLYFEVTDGTDNVIDPYTSNIDELEIIEPAGNQAPTVTPGATAVSPGTVNRLGSNTTTISTAFSDSDVPGVGAFNVTFKIREKNDITELTLVNAQPNGGGGLTITDQGSGNYTASYTYDPSDVQDTGYYDLYFEVTDGTDNVIDPYTSNVDELEIVEPPNNPPTVTPGATVVSLTPVNRLGTSTTIISTSFSDSDVPGVGAFNVTFKIREKDDITELTLVNNQPNGGGGLTITDQGSGNYTASYTYDPTDVQDTGLYDLYFEVTDGTDNVIDPYTSNVDELEINEVVVNNPPTVTPGATVVNVSPVNRLGTATTIISTSFSDADAPGVGAFNVTFKIREKNDVVELTLVNNQPNGGGGLTITDQGSGNYTASYTYDPSNVQDTGLYDLYFWVSDGSDNVTDPHSSNEDELEIIEAPLSATPNIVAGNTSVSPSSLDRVGAGTTQFSATFDDTDDPGVAEFWVTFKVQSPYSEFQETVADSLKHGVGGMSIADNGGGSYTATFDWDPADNQLLGYYDLQCEVADAYDEGFDAFANNADELLVTNGGENIAPVVSGDETTATPAAIERIGANSTSIAATFADGDAPGVGAFTVTFKLRDTNNVTEIVLADNVGNGVGGVTISDIGGGIYTASISWDPGDAQDLGYYDLYFHVTDGVDTSYDAFQNNLDELQLYDAISNNPPTLTAGATFPLPLSVNRIGTGYVMLKTAFSDVDEPGQGAFTITFKVRDLASGEVTVVNAAKHGEQGLRVVGLGGGNYEAAVLWDPDVAEPTGGHDLYFSVTDNNNATAIDDYASNDNELNVTSSAILGDGHLLRRNNDSTTCGGPNNACHNLPGHQDQDCRVCHTPHGTKNIYLVRDTIATPNSGDMEVIFKTLGIGDPYNDPDPVKGDPNSGVMADSTDGVVTGVCEVCHTTTTHHRNDMTYGSSDSAVHNDALDCTSGCHPHSSSFAVSGGGESSGGSNCSCHNSIFTPMNTSTTSYHHQLSSNAPDYASASRTCLMCHVDHDIFRDDLNTGFGTRAKNLRSAFDNSPVQGDATVLLNSDYQSSGAGGICLSCHTSALTKTNNPPDGSTQTAAISKTGFDAATGTHNYSVPSTFSGPSTFNANCVKCHNDTMTKTYQTGTYKFSAHDNPYGRLLNPFGAASPEDPLEEVVCFGCHSSTSNPNAGSNLDYFGVQAMSSTALRIEDAMSLPYGHPTGDSSGLHSDGENAAALGDGTRHAECGDCHSVHEALQGTHDGSTSLVSNALKGTWGVKPSGAWPDAPVPTDNANVFAAPSGFTVVNDATLEEWMICLKCHSNYTTLPSGNRNLAEEINPNYASTHGITSAGTNSYCNTTTMNEPWGSSGRTWCSDCHRSDNTNDPAGPHGSNQEHLLVETIVSDATNGTPLCHVCHKSSVYWNGSASASRYTDHPATQGQHIRAPGCFACHMWDHAALGGYGEPTDDWPGGMDNPTPTAPPIKIWVHGMNKKWVTNTYDGTAGTGDSTDAFVAGYLSNLDHVNTRCWTETCKNHANKDY